MQAVSLMGTGGEKQDIQVTIESLYRDPSGSIPTTSLDTEKFSS